MNFIDHDTVESETRDNSIKPMMHTALPLWTTLGLVRKLIFEYLTSFC